jgi:hypothetical protein
MKPSILFNTKLTIAKGLLYLKMFSKLCEVVGDRLFQGSEAEISGEVVSWVTEEKKIDLKNRMIMLKATSIHLLHHIRVCAGLSSSQCDFQRANVNRKTR